MPTKTTTHEDGTLRAEYDPFILVVPASLLVQVTTEAKRYANPRAIDIMPYSANRDTRKTWWASFEGSKQPAHRKLILAPASVSLVIHFASSHTYLIHDIRL